MGQFVPLQLGILTAAGPIADDDAAREVAAKVCERLSERLQGGACVFYLSPPLEEEWAAESLRASLAHAAAAAELEQGTTTAAAAGTAKGPTTGTSSPGGLLLLRAAAGGKQQPPAKTSSSKTPPPPPRLRLQAADGGSVAGGLFERGGLPLDLHALPYALLWSSSSSSSAAFGDESPRCGSCTAV